MFLNQTTDRWTSVSRNTNATNGISALLQTPDGGYILGGAIIHDSIEKGIFVAKLNATSDTEWSFELLGYPGMGTSTCDPIAIMRNSGYLMVGKITNYKNRISPLIFRLSDTGILSWGQIISYAYDMSFYSVIETSQSDYILVGQIVNDGNACAFIAKITNAGESIWTKVIGEKNVYATLASVVETHELDYIVAGYAHDRNVGVSGVLVVKLNNNGHVLWKKILAKADDGFPYAIAASHDGHFFLTGYTLVENHFDTLVIKINSTGEPVWMRKLTLSGDGTAKSITQTDDGGCMITGKIDFYNNQSSQVLIAKFSRQGKLNWVKILNDFDNTAQDIGHTIIQTYDNFFVFGGLVDRRIFLAKIDVNGSGIDLSNLYLEDQTEHFSLQNVSFETIQPAWKDYSILLSIEDITQNFTERNYTLNLAITRKAASIFSQPSYIPTFQPTSLVGSIASKKHAINFFSIGVIAGIAVGACFVTSCFFYILVLIAFAARSTRVDHREYEKRKRLERVTKVKKKEIPYKPVPSDRKKASLPKEQELVLHVDEILLGDAPDAISVNRPNNLLYILRNQTQEIKLVGSGSYGDVYYGLWKSQKVALKLYKNDCYIDRQEGIPIEVKIMRHLQNDYLVKLIGLVQDGTSPTKMVMEYAENESLYKYLHDSSKRMSLSFLLRIASELTQGLAYLHSKEIIHRDLKSANVVLGNNYQAKWCDFGLAIFEYQDGRSRSPVGTLNWRAPELYDPEYSSTKASDVWALGMVFFELIRREIPFDYVTDDAHHKQIVQEHGGEDITPEEMQKSPQFIAIIQRCWNIRSSYRPQAKKLVDEIQKTIHHHGF